MKQIKRLLRGITVLGLITCFISGCTSKKPDEGGTDVSGTDVPNPDVPDVVSVGELKEIRYEYSGGSMNPKTEFLADVTADEIVEAEFWETESADEMTIIKHQAVTEEQWADLVKITDDLRQFMVVQRQIYDDAEEKSNMEEEEMILDGGDYQNLYLTLTSGDFTETYQYVIPQDRRFQTLKDLLWELVDPKGREIVWYEAPEISGIFFQNKKKGYSYQFTQLGGEEFHRYYAYWVENGKKKSFSTKLTDEDWEPVKEFLNEQNLEELPKGSLADIGGTRYMSDGKQYGFTSDETKIEVLRAYFADYTEQLMAKN
ncbi:MAG: hypothetical protein J6S26_02910 [Solobacterium sp.]|nr:hypothetical protein [Solobacterium sp.]